jgi:hypothetical protein
MKFNAVGDITLLIYDDCEIVLSYNHNAVFLCARKNGSNSIAFISDDLGSDNIISTQLKESINVSRNAVTGEISLEIVSMWKLLDVAHNLLARCK